MAATKKRPVVGDETWFVEWCYELAFEDDGSVDRDRCKSRTVRAASKDEAIRKAREAFPVAKKTFGFVEYWPARFEPYDEDDAAAYPHVGFWKVTGDGEAYDGED